MHLAIVLAALLTSPPSASRAENVIHERSRGASAAVWVPLSRAVDLNGQIRWDLLGENAKENFDLISATPPFEVVSPREESHDRRYDLRSSGKLPDCVYYGPSYHQFASRPRESLEDLASSADWSVRGRVIAITPGFFQGEPFSLLTVKIDRTITSHKAQPSAVLYVLYPYAHFDAGDISFCKDDFRFPHIPAVSDQLVIFAPRGAVGAELSLLMPDRNYVIFESGRDLVLPRELTIDDHDIRSLDAVERRVRLGRGEVRR